MMFPALEETIYWFFCSKHDQIIRVVKSDEKYRIKCIRVESSTSRCVGGKRGGANVFWKGENVWGFPLFELLANVDWREIMYSWICLYTIYLWAGWPPQWAGLLWAGVAFGATPYRIRWHNQLSGTSKSAQTSGAYSGTFISGRVWWSGGMYQSLPRTFT